MGQNYPWLGGSRHQRLTSGYEALMMIFIWKLAAGSQALWVKILMAKYVPRSDIWHSKRDYRCSLEQCVTWNVCNRENSKVFCTTVVSRGSLFPQDDRQRNLRLNDLVGPQSGTWDVSRLVQLFGYENCVRILSPINTLSSDATQDTLIFKLTTNIQFSVKQSYNSLRSQKEDQQ